MKNLFLVDGASGTGKSDLLLWVTNFSPGNVGYVRKGTTRPRRSYEEASLDLDLLSAEDFEKQNFDYRYTYGGFQYGFSKQAIIDQLLKYDNVFIIVRNISLHRTMIDDFKFLNVVPVFLYTDRSALKQRLEASKATEEEIAARLERAEACLRDYQLHPDIYNEVIINNSSMDLFYGAIDKIVAKHSSAHKVEPFLISVMMSYNPHNPHLDDSYDAIADAIRSLSPKYECRRVNDSVGSPAISTEFRSLIASSRCVIVDLTESRLNVYYELGYVHAMRKDCLITATNATDLAFYPREYKVLRYESVRELRQQLAFELRKILRGIPL